MKTTISSYRSDEYQKQTRLFVNFRCFVVSFVFISGGVVSTAYAQPADSKSGSDKSRTQKFLNLATKAAGEYIFINRDDPQMKIELNEKPVLRWTNPIGGDWYGAVFVWTNRGRPEVIASIYQGYSRPGQPVSHEFHSLSLAPFTATRNERLAWSPQKAGLQLKPIPQADSPGKSSAIRSLQMRKLARGFKALKTEEDGTSRSLRLLSQPLYRYKSTNPDVLDGAIFSFVQATDPEVLLIIEARKSGNKTFWHYGLARMNRVSFEVMHNNRKVWDVPMISWDAVRDRQSPYSVFHNQ